MGGKTWGAYIHIPFCKSKCDYCAFCSITDNALMAQYVDALIDEIRSSPHRGERIDTLYIGGGTPSCLFKGALTDIARAVFDTFDTGILSEFTVEANPESCDAGFIEECLSCGVNRVSMGLQSASDVVLKSVGRIHTADDFISAANRLLRAGISNISSDIILGLPNSSVYDVLNAVGMVCDICSHVSVYALNVEEGTPLFAKGYNPDDDRIADMYDAAYTELKKRGFIRYEVSNFQKGGKISRHNSKYWDCSPYLGFGAAAHGYDGDSLRYYHSDDVKKYIRSREIFTVDLTDKDKYNEYVMLRLRTEAGIDEGDFLNRFGCEFTEACGGSLDKLIEGGYVVRGGGRVKIAPDKLFVMNPIIEELMRD